MSIYNQIIKLQKTSKFIADAFQIYYNKFEYSGFSGIQPYLSNEIIKSLRLINSDIAPLFDVKDIESVFNTYYYLINQYNILTRVIDIFNANQINLTKQGSSTSSGLTITLTYIKDLIQVLANANYTYELYKAEINSDDLINKIIAELSLDNITIDSINLINDVYLKYCKEHRGHLIINLYVKILYQINQISNDKEIVNGVSKIVEALKSQVLKIDEKILVNLRNISNQNRDANIIQKLIQLYNMIPANLSLPLNDIISANFKNIDSNDIGLICKMISNEKRFGFIIIRKIINKPLEYNIWTLIDGQYLENNNLVQPTTVGLNDVILNRCKTIRSFESVERGGENLQIFNQEFSENMSNNYYYLLETLDGINYRFLIPWSIEKKNISYYFPAAWLNNINNPEHSPSCRIESYNTIIANEICKSLHKPFVTMDILSRDEVQKEESYWKSLRNRIKYQILNDFTDLFTELGSVNINNLTSTILNDSLYKSALKHITENIELDNISSNINLDLVNQVQIELTSSYFYDLSNIQKGFRRDVENLYRKEYYKKVEHIVNSYQILEVKNKILEVLNVIMDEVLERFVNRRSGIYLSIQKKFDILNKTLLRT